jgi:hypothetical protein
VHMFEYEANVGMVITISHSATFFGQIQMSEREIYRGTERGLRRNKKSKKDRDLELRKPSIIIT